MSKRMCKHHNTKLSNQEYLYSLNCKFGNFIQGLFPQELFCHSQQQLHLLLGRGTSAESKMPNVFFNISTNAKIFCSYYIMLVVSLDWSLITSLSTMQALSKAEFINLGYLSPRRCAKSSGYANYSIGLCKL